MFLLLLFTGTVFTGAFAQSGPKPAEPPPTASVSGRVTLDGKPVAGVKVAVIGNNAFAAPIGRTTTDAAGRFRIGGLPDGSLTVAASAPASVGESDTQPFNGKTVTLAPGEAVEDIEIKLRPGGVITGRVTDSEKLPVIDQPITVFRLAKDQQTGEDRLFPVSFNGAVGYAKTDDRGVYRIYGLPPGRYIIAVGEIALEGVTRFSIAGGEAIPGTFHPGVTDWKQATAIELNLGEIKEQRDITVGARERVFSVSGRLVDDATGAPVPKMMVGVNSKDRSGVPGLFSGISDNRGEFRLTGVRSGAYDVVARVFGQESDYFAEPTAIEIRGEDVKDVTVRMKRGATLVGRVERAGGSGPFSFNGFSIGFQTLPNSGGPFNAKSAPLEPDGTFRLAGLKPGTYRCTILKIGAAVSGLRAVTLLRGDTDITLTGVEVGNDAISDLRVIAREATGKVRGEIRLVGGELPAGSRVVLSLRFADGDQTPGVGGRGEPDQRGRFLVDQLLPGTYAIRAWLLDNQSRTELKTFTPKLVTVPETGETTCVVTVDLSSQKQPRQP